MKKVGKTTRPFRYDLNQIPYDYTVEVRNRFKELDLVGRVPDKLSMEVHDSVQETGIKTIPKKKKCKKAKWLSAEALQIAGKRREVTNRFKGLDLIDRVPEELWTEVCNPVPGGGDLKPSPRKRNAKRQNGCLRRPYK